MSNAINSQNAIYAILADSVYWDVRERYTNPDDKTDHTKANWTPIPQGWQLIKQETNSSGSLAENGFTARAYKNGNFS